MLRRKVPGIVVAALLLAVLAVIVARDSPPTLIPYPGRFTVVTKSTTGGGSYLVDRWTGRLYAVYPDHYRSIPRVD